MSNYSIKFSVILIFAIIISSCQNPEDVVNPPDPPVVTPDTTRIFSVSYGTALSDLLIGAVQTIDNRIIACGYTISGAFGDNDIFIMKLDGSGNIIWANLYGSNGNDNVSAIEKLQDGSIIITGSTSSFSGTFDPFIIKLSPYGDFLWSKYYRWWNQDYASSVIQTSDAGYIISGHSNSFNIGGFDIFSLKLDQSGNIMWARTYGGFFDDFASSIKKTSDGGYIIGGYTFSYGISGDALIIKLYGDGIIRWAKSYGSSGFDNIKYINNSSNGFIACGSTNSFGFADETALAFNIDNQQGYVYWTKTYSGTAGGASDFKFVSQTPDGGFAFIGNMQNNLASLQDIVLLKLFGDGAFNYSKIFGANNNDFANSFSFKSDGGILISGYTESFGAGGNDLFLLSLYNSALGCVSDNPFTPVAGEPTLDIGEQNPAYFDVNFYETNSANWNVTPINFNTNIHCIQNP